MQSKGGFGSRRIFVGRFAGTVEFGPQQLSNINLTWPALIFCFRFFLQQAKVAFLVHRVIRHPNKFLKILSILSPAFRLRPL